MMKEILLLALLFSLGCVGGNQSDTNYMVPDVNDVNDSGYNDFDADDYIPTIPIPTDPNGIPNIPISNPPLPVGEDTPADEMTEEEYQALKEMPVLESDCAAFQYEELINAYIAFIPQAAGTSYEYEGIEEYRTYDWCKYNVKNEAKQDQVTHYANPHTNEVWQLVMDDGQTAEIHIEKGMMTEVCSNGQCQSMIFG